MKTTVKIPGMHCHSCVALVTEVSEESSGVQNVNVDLNSKEVSLEYDENFNLAAWTQEIESLGEDYKVLNQ